MYGSEFIKKLLPAEGAQPLSCPVVISQIQSGDYSRGGLAAALIRIIVLICGADGSFNRREFDAAQKLAYSNKAVGKLKPSEVKAAD